MKYFLLILLALTITACDNTPIIHNPNTQIHAINRTLREQYYNECIHENQNFDWVVQQENIWNSIQSTCRTSAYLRSIFPTTIGELAKHPDWVEDDDAY